jgi:molecular chaperone GrpE
MDTDNKQTVTSKEDKEVKDKKTVQTDELKEEKPLDSSSEDTLKKNEKGDEKEDKKSESKKEHHLSKEETLEKELKEAKEEIADYKDKYLRLAAEFDNYRKRTLKEKTELILNGSEKSINSILPVVDDLERALTNMEKTTDIKAVKEGIELIYAKFIQTLNQNGVKEIETIGKELDTDFHEAIAIVPVPDEKQKGKIIDCTQKGYTLNEKVIRHAKVVVGQ